MKPSRELDELIAEKVMGWTMKCGPMLAPPGYNNFIIKGVCVDEKGNIRIIPSYSTEISAAWEVVEKFRKNNSFIQLEVIGELGWEVALNGETGNSEFAPQVICLAALRAVGVEG